MISINFLDQHTSLLSFSSHCQLPFKPSTELFKVILPCTELYLHDLVAYSFVNCETEFSSSLDYSSGSHYFDDILLDRSDDSEDIIGVTEERMKGVERPRTHTS